MKLMNGSRGNSDRRWPRDHFSYSQWRVWRFEGPEAYAMKYVYWLEGETNPRMMLGKQVHEMVEEDERQDDPVLEHLRVFLPQYPEREQKVEADFGGLKLVAIPDGIDRKGMRVGELKTGLKWTQEMADCADPGGRHWREGAQLSWYALVLHLALGWRPERIRFELNWVPTVWEQGEMPRPTGEINTFRTRRTMEDVLRLGPDILKAWDEIGRYCARELAAIGK